MDGSKGSILLNSNIPHRGACRHEGHHLFAIITYISSASTLRMQSVSQHRSLLEFFFVSPLWSHVGSKKWSNRWEMTHTCRHMPHEDQYIVGIEGVESCSPDTGAASPKDISGNPPACSYPLMHQLRCHGCSFLRHNKKRP